MTTKEFAIKYAGCNCSFRNSGKIISNAPVGSLIDAKIVGYRSNPDKYGDVYLAVEILSPTFTTPYTVKNYSQDYTWVVSIAEDKPVYRIRKSEVILTSETNQKAVKKFKEIPQWPHKCRDCGSPAYIGANLIDCSNSKCHHKFKTNSGIDLFLPVELRPAGWDKTNTQNGLDAKNYIICPHCNKRARTMSSHIMWQNDEKTIAEFKCINKHSWAFAPQKGNKILLLTSGYPKSKVFDGKIFIDAP